MATQPDYTRFDKRNAQLVEIQTQIQLHKNIITTHEEQIENEEQKIKELQQKIETLKEHKIINRGLTEACIKCGPNCILDQNI